MEKRVAYEKKRHVFAGIYAEKFACNGKNIHDEGLASECSFCKPCGTAVEFDNLVYITDITPLINATEFSLYKAFSIHNRGDRYELQICS